MRYSSFIGLFCVGLFLNSVANAQSPSGVVRIGILNDQSGPYADFGGKTSVDAARMAVLYRPPVKRASNRAFFALVF